MSTAPRPHTKPSTISAPNGSRLHPSGFTGTTSVWPMSSSDGASGSVPSIRATRLWRPGCGSNISWSPAPDEVPRRAGRRCGSPHPTRSVPSFTHWLRMSSWSRSVTSAVGSSASRRHVLADPSRPGFTTRRPRACGARRTRPRCRRRAVSRSRRRRAVADDPEVELAAVRHHRDVDREVPRQRHERVHLEHLRPEAVERHLRARDVGDDDVGEALPVRGTRREPEQRRRGVLGEADATPPRRRPAPAPSASAVARAHRVEPHVRGRAHRPRGARTSPRCGCRAACARSSSRTDTGQNILTDEVGGAARRARRAAGPPRRRPRRAPRR